MSQRTFGYRWTVVALLFVATTINYVDRQVLGILAPTLSRELHWSETAYGDVVSWFSFAYALGFLVAGRVLDRIGVKRGLGAAVVIWSIASMAHALVRTATGFSIARAALGVGESAIFPGSIKSVAEWFPRRERALAAGLFNAGTNTGAIVAPLIVPVLALRWGWQWAFIVTGALGFLWLALWIPLYGNPERHPKVSDDELTLIGADPPDPPMPSTRWTSLLGYRQTWAFAVGKLLADPVWWFYLYWLPKFLDAKYGIKLSGIALPLIAVYLTADIGSIGGGWLSSMLIKRGWSVNWARKTAMLAMALLILPTTLAGRADSAWLAIAIVAVAAAAHQAWSANVYTLASDMFPRSAVGSVVGIGAFAGAMGGVFFQRGVGRLLDANGGNYAPIFVVCGSAYLVAWMLIQLLSPKLEPVA
ncbi:MAG TPA: MFS transporter [Gemmatimonadaceae bacterium]|nr:MFS transporter [Gemmatimonadaceae bacterium]